MARRVVARKVKCDNKKVNAATRHSRSKNMRQILRIFPSLLICLPLISSAATFVRDDIILNPTPERFSVCHGYSCAHLSQVGLKPAQWAEIRAAFHPRAESAAVERKQIRSAIAGMERFVGEITGTSADKGRNEPNDVGIHARMDCIDESTNTTLYLTMFKRQGLIHHHEVKDRVKRGLFPFRWPHYTAVIQERADASVWAVDSWYLDNGKPPYIVPLSQWRSWGWSPDTTKVASEK